ncbi:hypothetical protein COU78_05665 [Candidatus Peregrinibacteria bacterium CG10_big_fil_rev_8_21_14_0_10_49_24]|nr:MAG: hypothetical protein COV83_03450 [Candidatus Peregrinibacteria bacterium CG11_big_fil_rev_8_21_14_0_20_49_14]PIR50614.1 MAG: hypothetical protein COU78_05665 [Candidatus Peregrinibacteria bacterium CG10_big_fil_rev_8_21_14_0_10_49_24]PJA67068.1 MAG: hypothetical protein CO157_06440 [Candidatus Peregrinibacteria bacterium CG_4_9_14_3_um_filter_49_12]
MNLAIYIYQWFGFPLGVAIAISVAVFFIKNPEKFEKWASMIAWLVSRIYTNADYFATKAELQAKLNSFVGSLESHSSAVFPRVKIKWKAKGNDEVVWEEGNAIIVMRDRKHRNKNLVNASYRFTSEILLRKASRHLSKTQKLALDLFATQQILQQESRAALEQFMSDFYVPEIDKREAVRGLTQQYLKIAKVGLFFPTLVQELVYLGSKVFLAKPSQEIIEEVKKLTDFLEKFSEREVGDMDTPNTFSGKYTRCTIRIVASRAAREKGDITNHKEGINYYIRNKIENVYIIGSGEVKNKKFMNEVTSAVLEENTVVEEVKKYSFRGRIKLNGEWVSVKTYLIHLRNPQAIKHLYEENDIELSEE